MQTHCITQVWTQESSNEKEHKHPGVSCHSLTLVNIGIQPHQGHILPLTRGGITPKKLPIFVGEMESLPLILSLPNFKPVMAEKSYNVNITSPMPGK